MGSMYFKIWDIVLLGDGREYTWQFFLEIRDLENLVIVNVQTKKMT